MQCVAMTRKRKQCKNDAMEGQLVCRSHNGKTGRASEDFLDPQTRQVILDEIKLGAPPLSAGAAVGVSAVDMEALLEGDREFRLEVENAALALQAENYKSITKAAKSDWRAAVWLQDRMAAPVTSRGGPRLVPGGGAADAKPEPEAGSDVDYSDDQVGPDGKPL